MGGLAVSLWVYISASLTELVVAVGSPEPASRALVFPLLFGPPHPHTHTTPLTSPHHLSLLTIHRWPLPLPAPRHVVAVLYQTVWHDENVAEVVLPLLFDVSRQFAQPFQGSVELFGASGHAHLCLGETAQRACLPGRRESLVHDGSEGTDGVHLFGYLGLVPVSGALDPPTLEHTACRGGEGGWDLYHSPVRWKVNTTSY